MNKSFSIIGLRPSKGGDLITSLPILNLLEKKYPHSYKTVSVAKKNSVFAPLLFNHPLIDRIHINEILEKPNKEDYDFFNSHNLIIPPNLQHPNPHWYNEIGMVEENFRMMGFDWNELEPELRIPKLVKWFDIEKYNNYVSIWPFAGDYKDKYRSPSFDWWKKALLEISKMGINIFHCGHFNEPIFENIPNLMRICEKPLFDQIKVTLGTNLCVNSDSGSGLVMAAYNMNQITILTNWNENHINNFCALEPMNNRNITLFSPNSCDNLDIYKFLQVLKDKFNE